MTGAAVVSLVSGTGNPDVEGLVSLFLPAGLLPTLLLLVSRDREAAAGPPGVEKSIFLIQ